jgi:hypothetical protein
MKKMFENQKLKLFLFCLFVSFVCLFICSKNSPLYPFNNWVDENAFFTVAKAWYHGIIPYRDIFEQKGPLLYLIFIIGYLLSNHSFFGVFILELISFTVCLIYVSKIIKLFLKEEYIYYILPLFASIITSSFYFVHGGSAEEFCFPLLAISVYYLLRNFIKEKINYKEYFINGLIAGFIAMIKYNLLGFWFGFMFFLLVSMLIDKDFKKAFLSGIVFLIGMFIPIMIFILYFYFNNALTDFINTYFLFNANNYAIKLSLKERSIVMLKNFYSQVSGDFLIFNLIDAGFLYFIFNKKLFKNNMGKVCLLSMFLFGGFGIFIGGLVLNYYFLLLEFFIILGLIALFYQIFENKKLNSKINIILIICVLLFSMFFLKHSNNLPYHHNQRDNLVQYKFAKIINKKQHPTLLNYGSLDSGFYFAADIIPNTKYFEFQNAPVPHMLGTLHKEIKNKKFDFIVIRCYDGYDPRDKVIYDNYKLINSDKEIFEGINFTYYLYEKK